MNRLLPVLFVLSIAAGHALAADNFQPEAGFVRLDNGTDLEGWYGSRWSGEPAGDARGWSVVDGAIRLDCDKASSHLFSKTRFSRNCVIRLEFNAAHAADSGICLHGKQFQVRDYPNKGPYHDLRSYRPEDWNELTIHVRGQVAQAICNGEVLEEAIEVPPSGPIGLESDLGQVEFRNIRVKPLP